MMCTMFHMKVAAALVAVALSTVANACVYEIDTDITGALPPYSAIELAVQDFDCGDVDATFNVPSRLNFRVFVNSEDATEITTSAPDMVIPFVEDGTLRFRWNRDRPTTVPDDDGSPVAIANDSAGIQILFPPTGVSKIETTSSGETTAFTADVEINAGFGDLAEIVNGATGTSISVIHGGSTGDGLEEEYPSKDLTYRTLGTSTNVQLSSAMNVTLDLQGSAQTGHIMGNRISGAMSTESGDFKLSSFGPLDVTMNGNLGLLFVDSRTPGGCNGVNIATQTAGTCDDESQFNFDVDTVSCEISASPQEIVCGTGGGDGGGGEGGGGSAAVASFGRFTSAWCAVVASALSFFGMM